MELWSLQNVSTHQLYQRLLSRYDMIPISTGYVKGYEKIKYRSAHIGVALEIAARTIHLLKPSTPKLKRYAR